MIRLLNKIRRDQRGSMAIETALVAPMLIIMTLGTFEVGTVVARQHELQSAANEAEIIILATNGGATVDTNQIKSIIRESVDLPEDNIVVERRYRCNTSGKVKSKDNCPSGAVISNYVDLSITDRYEPTWTAFGVGKPVTFSVNRSVLIS